MSASKPHILIVSSEFPPHPGGIGNHACNLATQLQHNGYETEVISDNRSFAGVEEAKFDAALTFRVRRIKRRRFRVIMYLDRILVLFNAIRRADLVIASGKFSLWIVALAGSMFRKRTLAVVHGTEVNFRNKTLKGSIHKSLKRFTRIIAVSHFTKSLLPERLLSDTVVIPNGFDAGKLTHSHAANGNIPGHPKLVTVGNVTPRKGQLNVIRMLPQLTQTFPNIHYHCIGIPTLQTDFLSVASELGVQDHISFHGKLTDADMVAMLADCDVFVMLSGHTESGDVEGFGIAILEANFLGLPAIGSYHSGIEDAIKDGYSGRLVAADNADEFVKALSEILENQDEYGSQARSWADQHRWEFISRQYIDVLKGML